MEEYVGKIYKTDFTNADLQREFPEYDIFVSRLGALALANFRPDRLRVWTDDDDKVVKIVTG